MTKRIFYKNKAVIIIILVILIIAGSVAVGNRAFSYNDTITHPSLTGNIAKIYNANSELKLTEQEIGWLKQGSIEEDRAPRWMNHFYNPIAGVGLLGGFSSKVWAESPFLQIKDSGDNETWQRAIDSYADGDRRSAFIALGHVLHLLEDATVPAHTRLDAHLEGDPYEGYVVDKIGWDINFGTTTPIVIKSLGAAFDDLANYSSKNFLSKDTVSINNIINKKTFFKKINENEEIECVEGIVDNNVFCLMKIKDVKGKKEYSFDLIVHSDYFSLLAPKAVSYGAGVVKLFFDEAEKAKKEYEQKSWWEKLKESANQFFSGFSGSLYAGIGISEGAPSKSEAPEVVSSIAPAPAPTPVSLPANTVEAREKIVVNLPLDTVVAQEKLGGNIAEEVNPRDSKIPSAIVEEVVPGQANLPSPSPLTFLPGMGGAAATPTPTPSPSPGPDTTPPETTIASQPSNPVAFTTAVFIFTSSESGSNFGCQLDGAATSSCVSPKEYAGLSEASHNFKVSATDAAGNQDLTPAEHSWIVDLTAPQLSNITSTPGRTSALISWTASEAGIFQIEYGTSTNYDLVSATTSAVSLSINFLTASTTYHFRLLAQDSLANATSTTDDIFTTTSQAENIVISEIKIGNTNAADDEWIELYNSTNADIDLEALPLKLHIRNSVGTDNNKVINFTRSVISAKGFFLLTSAASYTGGVPADATYGGSKLVSNGGLYISTSTASSTDIIDQVGWGAQPDGGYENTAFADSPSATQSLERKAFINSTSSAMVNGIHQWSGNGYDSDNNAQDFVLQPNPNPQNSLMLTEPRTSLPGLMTASAWPTWQGNLARTGQTAAVSLATSTLTIKRIATTTVAQSFNSRPILDSAGNIYIGRADGLAKYSAAGNLVWLYISASNGAPPPLISDDETIFFRNADALYAIDKNGQLKWKHLLDGTVSVNAALAFTPDGAIVTQGGQKVFVINQDATLKWSFDFGREVLSSSGVSAPVVDGDGKIYIAMDKYVYALSATGQLLWEKGDDLGWCSSMSLSGNVLYLTVGTIWPTGGVYALSVADGSIIWSNVNGYNDKAYLAPVVDSADNIYVILFYFNSHHLNAYSATASSTSFLIHDNSLSPYLAAPILTSDGKIYLADQNLLKVFDAADGALLGFFSTPDNQTLYNYFGAIGADGIIYTATSNSFGGTLYAIGSGG